MKDKARIIEDKILDLIDCSNDIPKGDIQGLVTVTTQDIIELFNNSINKELLEACKSVLSHIEGELIDIGWSPYIKTNLKNAINKAEG